METMVETHDGTGTARVPLGCTLSIMYVKPPYTNTLKARYCLRRHRHHCEELDTAKFHGLYRGVIYLFSNFFQLDIMEISP
jgi:hypothetical protein